MEKKELNTEEKILKAAIELFPMNPDITTREIAGRAEVNIAAINYHFKSKDNLLKVVEKHYSDILYENLNKIIEDESINPRDKLTIWSNDLMEFMFKWPALITLVSNLILGDREYKSEIINKFFVDVEIKNEIQDIISELTGVKDKEKLNHKYIQLFSGVLGPILFQVISMVSGNESFIIDFSSEMERKKYIESLIQGVIDK